MRGKVKSVAILNSRQSLRPAGSDPWVKDSCRAVLEIIRKDQCLLTSVGMNTWELLVYLAARNKICQKIYIPIESGQNRNDIREFYRQQFRLKAEYTEWRFIEIGSIKKDYHIFQKKRDTMIIGHADIIYPVALRPASSLDIHIRTSMKVGAVIDIEYKTAYSSTDRACKINIDTEKLNPEIDNQLDDFIIHWTRSSNHRWPGETLYDYYDAIVNSNAYYPRSAVDTLMQILTERRLRASSRHYRRGISAVAFSSLKPSEAIDLMKWRARYREMTFEPYGIAVRKKLAEQIGIRKVIYGIPGEYNNLSDSDKPYFQSIGTRGFWVPEREWRHIGDMILSGISPNDLRIIVWRKNELSRIRKLTDINVKSIYA